MSLRSSHLRTTSADLCPWWAPLLSTLASPKVESPEATYLTNEFFLNPFCPISRFPRDSPFPFQEDLAGFTIAPLYSFPSEASPQSTSSSVP